MYVTLSCFSVFDPEPKKEKVEYVKQPEQQPDVPM
jgi:hypothetical protein